MPVTSILLKACAPIQSRTSLHRVLKQYLLVLHRLQKRLCHVLLRRLRAPKLSLQHLPECQIIFLPVTTIRGKRIGILNRIVDVVDVPIMRHFHMICQFVNLGETALTAFRLFQAGKGSNLVVAISSNERQHSGRSRITSHIDIMVVVLFTRNDPSSCTWSLGDVIFSVLI